MNATRTLIAQHRAIQSLFDELAGETRRPARTRAASRLTEELIAHMAGEEAVFYPAARRVLGRLAGGLPVDEHFMLRAQLRRVLATDLDGPAFEEPVDGITLVQRYIKAPAPFITRVEFVGGQFLYAVQVDTSEGFELCPADACRVDAADASGVCPAQAPGDKFRILRDFNHPLLPRWQAFLAANDIGIAGIEFIVDEAGRPFTYDINTNTNYNPDAEAKDGRSGMRAVAGYLGGLLARARQPHVRRTGT